MALPKTGKLVRDLIPQVIEASGKQAITTSVTNEDLVSALLLKIDEEVREVLSADGDQVLEEIADVYEVLLALANAAGSTWTEIESIAEKKRVERGGFSGGIWLLDTKSN
jgi:predicted house-cleaning noncanonical NTP pyrophosphatase (MazG superfamily)